MRDATRKAVITVLVLGALAGLFFTGQFANTGLGTDDLPEGVQRLDPPPGGSVLVQSQIGMDIDEGYDVYLQINGTEVRTADDGLIKDLGTGQIRFQPGPQTPVESLNQGTNCVVAFIWDRVEGPNSALPVSWCFDAT